MAGVIETNGWVITSSIYAHQQRNTHNTRVDAVFDSSNSNNGINNSKDNNSKTIGTTA